MKAIKLTLLLGLLMPSAGFSSGSGSTQIAAYIQKTFDAQSNPLEALLKKEIREMKLKCIAEYKDVNKGRLPSSLEDIAECIEYHTEESIKNAQALED